MCGRYTFYDSSTLVEMFDLQPTAVAQLEFPLEVNYNVAPGHVMPVIVRGEQENTIEMMRWGLIPAWAKDDKIGYKMINARQETLLQKNTWKRLVGSRRCLIPANGFYEWFKHGDNKTKQPYYIHFPGRPLFSFAGLWDTWRDPSGKTIKSFTIITTSPNQEMAAIHDRMPVILSHQAEEIWLQAGPLDAELLHDLTKPLPDGSLELYKVSSTVNKSGDITDESLLYRLPE